MQTPSQKKLVGFDIAYPVVNIEGKIMGVVVYDVLDDDRDLICSCPTQGVAITITGLLNNYRPHEWKGG